MAGWEELRLDRDCSTKIPRGLQGQDDERDMQYNLCLVASSRLASVIMVLVRLSITVSLGQGFLGYLTLGCPIRKRGSARFFSKGN